jgi:hypothetical protein
MSSCPRCGSNRTSRALRTEGKVLTNIEDQWCDDCGWHGVGYRNVAPTTVEPKPKAKTPRKKKVVAAPPTQDTQVAEPVLDTPPREDDPCSYLMY